MIVAAGVVVLTVIFLLIALPVMGRKSMGGANRVQNRREQTLSVPPLTNEKTPQIKMASLPVAEDVVQKIVHVPLPEEVRGLYWTAMTAATRRADELLAYMKKTGLNTAVIDLKMDDGELGFAPNDHTLQVYAMKKPVIKDLDALLKKLADDHVYRIARIQVMKDSMFAAVHPGSAMRYASGAMWRDKTGSAWVDPVSPDVATYAVALAREAYARGFDEVQFDYVRFASDGKISAITYPYYNGKETKVQAMKRFFEAVGGPLKKDGIPVSFDLFGLVCMSNDGLGIGQRLDAVMPSADFVSPMVYPSHYANGFQGFANPAVHPYEVVKISLDHALGILVPSKVETSAVKQEDGTEKTVKKIIPPSAEEKQVVARKFRPWIQDFDIGAVYTASMIEAQIKAARDAGASGFLIWNARNVYEPANYTKEKTR